MSTNETWNLEAKTPFKVQKSILHLSTSGNFVTGNMEAGKDVSQITDVTKEGDTLSWKAHRKIMNFEFNVKIEGNTMTGFVKSRLGKAPVKGTRVS